MFPLESFNLTSTGVTDCTSCSRPSKVRPGSLISWLVLLTMSISTLLDFPFFTVNKVSVISNPLGHGLDSSGSNSTGVVLSTGPVCVCSASHTLTLSGRYNSIMFHGLDQAEITLITALDKIH